MSTFRVAFDGWWQGNFDDLNDAVEWARDVSETGRMTWVVERRGIRLRLRAAFPEGRAMDAEEEWKRLRRDGRANIFMSGIGGG